MSIVRPKKYLGQHFLNDRNIAEKIVESILSEPITNVIEVGPGMGVLTQFLTGREGISFKAVEIDAESVSYLRRNFPAFHGCFIHGDFLKMDLSEVFSGKMAVIGNFPYNISSQIFFRVLDYRQTIPIVVGMLQKEVARRICSGPGNKNYGILSVLLQAYYHAEYLFEVPPHVFIPPPKVTSAVIRLKRNDRVNLNCDEVLFKKIVKASFNQRRKILKNSLSIFNVEIQPEFAMLRPEQLTVEQFISITSYIQHSIRTGKE